MVRWQSVKAAGDMTFEKVTNVVDTTAAGDSFNAGYLAAHIAGQSGREAILKGHCNRLKSNPGTRSNY